MDLVRCVMSKFAVFCFLNCKCLTSLVFLEITGFKADDDMACSLVFQSCAVKFSVNLVSEASNVSDFFLTQKNC